MGLLPLLLAACAPKAPAPVPHDAAAALDGCRAGLEAAHAAGQNRGAEGLAAYAASCAALYREPACRTATADLMTVPVERRAWSIASACRDAYCPTLPAPRPALCDTSEPDPIALAGLWPELHARILQDDLGPAYADYVELVAWFAGPPVAVALAPAEPPPARPPNVAVTIVSMPGRFVLDVGGTTVDLPGDATVEALAEQLRPLVPDTGAIVLVDAHAASDADVQRTIEALKRLGVSRFALNVPAEP